MLSIETMSANFAQMYEQHFELAIAMTVVIGAAITLLIKWFFFRSTENVQVLISSDDDETTHTPTPRVPITIGGTVVPAVWATGSTYSYIKDSLAKKLFSPDQILPTNERAKAMGGKPFKFIGAVKCNIKIGSLEFPHMFFIVPDNFITDALLGYDFISELGTSFSLRLNAGTLTLGEEVIALCMKDGSPYQSEVPGEAPIEFPSLYSVR